MTPPHGSLRSHGPQLQSTAPRATLLIAHHCPPQADVVWGPVSSGQTAAVLPVTEARRKLLLAHGASEEAIFSETPGHQYVVSTLAPARDYMYQVTQHSIETAVHEACSFSGAFPHEAMFWECQLIANL